MTDEAKSIATLHISGPENAGASWQLQLADDFETVFNKLFPLTPPSSSLEHRANMEHRLADGRLVAFQPSAVVVLEEAE